MSENLKSELGVLQPDPEVRRSFFVKYEAECLHSKSRKTCFETSIEARFRPMNLCNARGVSRVAWECSSDLVLPLRQKVYLSCKRCTSVVAAPRTSDNSRNALRDAAHIPGAPVILGLGARRGSANSSKS